jgi:NADH-quinone oxidoreductase subunit N
MALTSFTKGLASHDTMAVMGVALVTIAFFLKAAIVPFHAWAPDAYEGASIPVTAYMSTAIKAGALLAAARLFSTAAVPWQVAALIASLPLISIVWGNLTAMKQMSFRRMIAYSSIAHAGYLFYAFLGDGPGRFQAVVFYLLAYGLMNLLAFAAIPPGDEATRDRLENLKGLWHREPFSALVIGMAMLSLAGIPPFPGFIGKFLIFKNVIAAGYTTYAVLGLIGSYLGIYFYLRVIQFMFMSPQEALAGAVAPRRVAIAASLVCLVPVVLVAVFPGWVLGRF